MAREKSPSQRWIICSYKAEVLHTDHPYISLFCEATSLPPARPQQPSVTLQVLHARFLLALDSKFQTHLESSPHIFQPIYLAIWVPSSILFSWHREKYFCFYQSSSLGSEGNHEKQRAGENVIKTSSHVPALASSKTWLRWPCGSGFRMKDRRKGLWNFPHD